MEDKHTFAVIGAGSWGTALAMLLAGNGHETVLWGKNATAIKTMQATRCNAKYLGEIPFPENLRLTADWDEALAAANTLLFAIPSTGFADILEKASAHIEKHRNLVWATKGLDAHSGHLLHSVVEAHFSKNDKTGINMAVISGPNFAKEVALKMPTATTIASPDIHYADTIGRYLHNDWFRAYGSSDIIGVELAGALKNALAIAAGISDGLGFGANAKAALLTRGVAEITRLGVAMGGQQQTFMGLAGIGDIMLTCTDDQSRNRRFGLALAKAKNPEEAMAMVGQTVEGSKSAKAAILLSQEYNVELPIIEQVCRVLYEGLSPRKAVASLLQREQKLEHG